MKNEKCKTMDKRLEMKKRLVKKCLAEQVKIEEHNKALMKEAQETANEYEHAMDMTDTYRTQMLEKRDMFARQLAKIIEERKVLERIDTHKTKSCAEFGSVVITDQNRLFISIGLGKVCLDGEEFFAISPMVPLFKAMEGKKKGETFTFNGKSFRIVDVF